MTQPQMLRVVVASPDDVPAERHSLDAVAAELNGGVAAMAGLRLEISRWETDAYPGFHPQGPQGLMDSVLRIEDCDVLIGIFWKRFGTPAADSGSGTEHTFRLAYEAWKRQGYPQILVYFNQKAYTPRSKAEAEQWGLVLEFQQNFPKEGLWWSYKGKAQFERLVRSHLTQWIRRRVPLSAPEPVAALRDGGEGSDNLPTPPTPFVGREADIAEWYKRLRQPATRLLTLTGLGGVGKSRVALLLAQRCAESRDGFVDDGVWWVGLEEAGNGAEMLGLIARQLRLTHPPETALTVGEQVALFLRDKRLLLVLDGAERAADAVGDVVRQLLGAAPGLRCLVTSRRALRLRAETAVEVDPLSAPDAEQLFVERARAAQDDFAVTGDNAGDIAELCRRLEGVPLAIELAAARIVGMTPREMLTRLSGRFRLLQSRARDLPPRQRALRAAIDWSHDLLTDEDRSLFAQLSLFVGGFTMADAEAVCDAPDVFEGVLTLRGDSLLRKETDAASQQDRFTLLESLREYAAEKLREMPDVERAARRRHAEHFVRFARERLPRFRTPDEARALHELDEQNGNLRAAMAWAREAGPEHVPLHVELALAVGVTLLRRGFQHEAAAPFEEGLKDLQPAFDAHGALLARLLRERAALHLARLELPEARARAHEALVLYQQRNDAPEIARTENVLGEILRRENNFTAAREYYARARAQAEQSRDAVDAAIVLNNLGLVELSDPEGDREAAARHLNEALRLRRELGDARGLAETLNNLGNRAFAVEDWDEARRRYREALGHEQALRHTFGVARALNNLGEVAMQQGKGQDACRLFAAAERLFSDVRSPHAAYTTDWFDRAAAASACSEAAMEYLRQAVGGKSLDDLVSWVLSGS